ncbi:CoxG family protein [Neobacillus drentensis]|uniref:CoxG family protein n=1 Tax=Neobacillus drentensis TaxID=220684 RepID=UPI002FFFB249
MRLEYDYTFGLPRNIVWKYIKDEQVLRNALPGCKSFSEVSKGRYQAELEVNIGPIHDRFALEIRLIENKSSSLIQLQVKGTGNLGDIAGNADLYLKDQQGSTPLKCIADARVTGALALGGQRLLEGGANSGLETFFQKVEKDIKIQLYYLKRKGR